MLVHLVMKEAIKEVDESKILWIWSDIVELEEGTVEGLVNRGTIRRWSGAST